MCPVELGWTPPSAMLDLLPIETRRDAASLDRAARRPRRLDARRRSIPPIRRSSRGARRSHADLPGHADVARELGPVVGHNPEDNPPLDENGQVEVPAWRHAMINYPHPLLARGLVILDTPGLNAIGTEPELTLGLLPGAHAALFLLGGRCGRHEVRLSVWNQHLGGQAMALLRRAEQDRHAGRSADDAGAERGRVQRQCEVTAQTLQMPRDRVFPGLGAPGASRALTRRRRAREEPPARPRIRAGRRTAAGAPDGAHACA
jgi:hypothetical protein